MMYSAKQVAEMLPVGIGIVNGFVDAGQLDAIDVSLTRGKKGDYASPKMRYVSSWSEGAFMCRRRAIVLVIGPGHGRSSIFSRSQNWKRTADDDLRSVMSRNTLESKRITLGS